MIVFGVFLIVDYWICLIGMFGFVDVFFRNLWDIRIFAFRRFWILHF